jgi:hypothetical protein
MDIFPDTWSGIIRRDQEARTRFGVVTHSMIRYGHRSWNNFKRRRVLALLLDRSIDQDHLYALRCLSSDIIDEVDRIQRLLSSMSSFVEWNGFILFSIRWPLAPRWLLDNIRIILHFALTKSMRYLPLFCSLDLGPNRCVQTPCSCLVDWSPRLIRSS